MSRGEPNSFNFSAAYQGSELEFQPDIKIFLILHIFCRFNHSQIVICLQNVMYHFSNSESRRTWAAFQSADQPASPEPRLGFPLLYSTKSYFSLLN